MWKVEQANQSHFSFVVAQFKDEQRVGGQVLRSMRGRADDSSFFPASSFGWANRVESTRRKCTGVYKRDRARQGGVPSVSIRSTARYTTRSVAACHRSQQRTGFRGGRNFRMYTPGGSSRDPSMTTPSPPLTPSPLTS
jgi:hypothetical protein